MKVWEVEVSDQFGEWWSALTDDQREALTDRVDGRVGGSARR